jgi:hypothetical protein
MSNYVIYLQSSEALGRSLGGAILRLAVTQWVFPIF